MEPAVATEGEGGWSGAENEGVRSYFQAKVEELEQKLVSRLERVRGLRRERDRLNRKVRELKEEMQLMQSQASLVAEVVKPMDASAVLVKVQPEGKLLVGLEKGAALSVADLKPGVRVALRPGSNVIHRALPNKVDPLVALMMVEKVPDASYEMVGGLDKQLKEMKEVIELPVKFPELFAQLGMAEPKGVLLYGPPGTGKTLLARAVAHHSHCTFIRVSGSELVQKYIGEGARMVRDLFQMARQHAPSIIFMDEIDSIGSSRTGASDAAGGDSEVQRTMLELLNQLDGFTASNKVKVIMATNRMDVLDSALLRPGRIDRKIELPAPDAAARLQILKIHSRKMNLRRGLNLAAVAEGLKGASGAEVKAVCPLPALSALRQRRVHISQQDFLLALAKLQAQPRHSQDPLLRKLFK